MRRKIRMQYPPHRQTKPGLPNSVHELLKVARRAADSSLRALCAWLVTSVRLSPKRSDGRDRGETCDHSVDLGRCGAPPQAEADRSHSNSLRYLHGGKNG